MQAKLETWNGGLGLRIPDPMATATWLKPESLVDIVVQNGRLVVTPINTMANRLNELLDQVTDENLHEEVDTGAAVGREVW